MITRDRIREKVGECLSERERESVCECERKRKREMENLSKSIFSFEAEKFIKPL